MLDLKSAIEGAKISLLAGGAMIIALVSAYIGYALNAPDPAVICAPQIERIDLLVTQARATEDRVADERVRYLDECMRRETEMCHEKMSELKKRLTDLRCRICDAQEALKR
jgi:hypothetical protein